jgi:hypothetical protein
MKEGGMKPQGYFLFSNNSLEETHFLMYLVKVEIPEMEIVCSEVPVYCWRTGRYSR